MKRLVTSIALVLLLALSVSCKRECRCYRYDGNVDYFTDEELEKYDRSCTGMEQFDLGEVYSICEKAFF